MLRKLDRLAISCLLLIAVTLRVEGFVDPLDQPSELSSIAQSTPLLAIANAGQRLVAAGKRGHILYSDNNGKTWVQAQVPASVTLTALTFPTPEQGWAVGHSGIVLNSNDSGATWQRLTDGKGTGAEVLSFYKNLAESGSEIAAEMLQRLPINWKHGAEQPWLGVWFEDNLHGFITGPFNLIMETQDGGRNWVPWMHRVDNPIDLHLNAITQVGGSLFMPSEQGLVFRMKLGEKKFSSLQTPYTGSFFGVCGNDKVVLAYGLRGTVYSSLDQGENWSLVETETKTALTACTATNNDTFLLSAASGNIVEVQLLSENLTSKHLKGAPWPLTEITTIEGRPVGVGLSGVWVSPK